MESRTEGRRRTRSAGVAAGLALIALGLVLAMVAGHTAPGTDAVMVLGMFIVGWSAGPY